MMGDTLAIIGVFFVPAALVVLIVWFKSNEKRKRYQLQADLYAKALEKGESVPADLFADFKKAHNPLHTGIILLAAGIGISLFFVLMAVSLARIEADAYYPLMSVASVGVVPFMVGVAYVIIHFIEKRKAVGANAK